jgi:serine/threonine protein kinase
MACAPPNQAGGKWRSNCSTRVILHSDVARRRFEREIEVASLLEHPNIARVYDSNLSPGVYFYSMELIDGVSLDEFVESKRLNRRASLSLMSVVCRAIQYAHEKGVIHRDLKPSNIMVDRNGGPHIVDFGLGKLINDVPFSTISLDGDWAGTPAYMSPEQAAGRVDDIGTRSDIYSLGVILYQLMTGPIATRFGARKTGDAGANRPN